MWLAATRSGRVVYYFPGMLLLSCPGKGSLGASVGFRGGFVRTHPENHVTPKSP
jgi:hypothetical protein